RVIGQINERTGPKGRNDLALAHLPVRPLLLRGGTHDSSSSASISMLSSVLSQKFTFGSTSRIDRLARNFICLDERSFSSGSRTWWSRGFPPPISIGLY